MVKREDRQGSVESPDRKWQRLRDTADDWDGTRSLLNHSPRWFNGDHPAIRRFIRTCARADIDDSASIPEAAPDYPGDPLVSTSRP
jgi:hypothetical protein